MKLVLLDVLVEVLELCGIWLSGVSWFWWGALGFLGLEQQVDLDEEVVAIERGAGDGVYIVDDVAPVFVYDGMV